MSKVAALKAAKNLENVARLIGFQPAASSYVLYKRSTPIHELRSRDTGIEMAELYGNPGGLPLDSLHYWRKHKQLRRQRRAIRSASKPQQDACLGTSQSSSPSE